MGVGNSDFAIELVTGAYFDLAAPSAGVVTLKAIAHGLSNTCRFTGQTRRFYSVAEHAVLVSEKVAAAGGNERVQMLALHHDDAEAFLGDVTRPLKALIAGYGQLEIEVAKVIAEALQLPETNDSAADWIKDADNWALACEAYYLLPSRGRTWFCAGRYDPSDKYQPAQLPVCLSPDHAAAAFVRRHRRLEERLRG